MCGLRRKNLFNFFGVGVGGKLLNVDIKEFMVNFFIFVFEIESKVSYFLFLVRFFIECFGFKISF